MPRSQYLKGTLLLSFTGFILKIMGMWYRIFLSRLFGAEGMGILGLVSPVYSFVVLTLTSGISVTVSRIVAREKAAGNMKLARRVMVYAVWLMLFASLLVSFVLLLMTEPISTFILKDPRCKLPLLVIVPFVPLIAIAAAVRGYFYGIQKILPVAIAQVLEQITKIVIVLSFAKGLLENGLETACALAILATAAGEIANLIVVSVAFLLERANECGRSSKTKFKLMNSTTKEIIRESIPISLNRFVISIMLAVEVIIIPVSLVKYGYQYTESIAEFGRLTGMAMPLIFIPTLFTSSLATNLVPAISEALSQKNIFTANQRISRSIAISACIGSIFAAVFFSFSTEICEMLYPGQQVSGIVKTLSYTCFFLYLQQTMLGILNGLGKQASSLVISVIGCGIRIFFVLMVIPTVGLKGYIWSLALSSALVCFLDFWIISKTTGLMGDVRLFIIKPLLCGVLALWMGRFSIQVMAWIKVGGMISLFASLSLVLLTGMIMMDFLSIFHISEFFSFRRSKKLK